MRVAGLRTAVDDDLAIVGIGRARFLDRGQQHIRRVVAVNADNCGNPGANERRRLKQARPKMPMHDVRQS